MSKSLELTPGLPSVLISPTEYGLKAAAHKYAKHRAVNQKYGLPNPTETINGSNCENLLVGERWGARYIAE
jgi:hypothetical protein